MSVPLVLQIQQALLDNSSSLSEALRKAKVVCFKLGLAEFEAWVDHELEGYMNSKLEDIPDYRKLYGTPEAFNPYQGWQPIIFASTDEKKRLSLAPIGMSIEAIEQSVRHAKSDGAFSFPYDADIANDICQSMNWGDVPLHIKLSITQCSGILGRVRDILLNWTLQMEKQGIVGNDLTFNEGDRQKSAQLTESVITNIHIGQVGAFVQNATHATVQGEVKTTTEISKGVLDLVQKLEQWLPTANFSAPVEQETRKALVELRDAGNTQMPDKGRIARGLEALKRVVAPAGENLLKFAVDAGVSKLLESLSNLPPPT
jgi:hypothetical protein